MRGRRWGAPLAVALACCLGAGLASAQEADKAAEGEAGSGEATESPAAGWRRVDELAAKVAILEEKLQGALGPQEAATLREELAALRSEQERLAQALRASECLGPCREVAPLPAAPERLQLRWGGFVRVAYTHINDTEGETDFVGLNDGFQVQNARLSLRGSFDEWLRFRVELEGANDVRTANNTATGELSARLRDAWVGYARVPWMQLRVGQFKPFFDAEEKRSSDDLLFVSRALAHSGVRGVEGFNVRGLSLNRDVGAQLLSEPLLADLDGIKVGGAYMLSVVNGNGANSSLNDNEAVAVVGRAEGLLEVPELLKATLGLGYFVNKRTLGEPPDRFSEERQGLAVDLDLEVAGLVLQGQYTRWDTNFSEVQIESDRVAVGYHVAAGYRLPYGLTPAYRFAFLDPTAEFATLDPGVTDPFDVDELTHHTVGLTWHPLETPFTFQVNYTLTIENDARALDNDRLELLSQVEF